MRLATTHITLLIGTIFAATTFSASLTDWEQIHQTLNRYAIAIDSKDFGMLSCVFTHNAFANYTGALSNLTGLTAIEQGLAASVAHVDSQHLLGTTVIDIHGKRQDKANSTTYFQATLFGKPYSPGSLVTLYGYYVDRLVKLEQGWRINDRLLVFRGPGFVGNLTLVGG